VVRDPPHFTDVVCSFCGRHNREVRVVSNEAGLIVCQVCVAKAAEIFDQEVGIDPPPVGWSERWPLKTS
jgi:ClpX C4-type zinc finger